MAKNVLRKCGVLRDTALVILGWFAFAFGAVLRSIYPVASLALLVIARVLPQALLSSKNVRFSSFTAGSADPLQKALDSRLALGLGFDPRYPTTHSLDYQRPAAPLNNYEIP